MKNTKTQKGITLVALIITIIVLLILAVVAIASVEESGIIKHAENAVAKHNEGKELEDNRLEGYENFLAEYANRGKINYYIYDDYLIQKIDLIEKTITTLNLIDDTVSTNKIVEPTGTGTVSEDIEITLLDDTTRTIEAGSLKFEVEMESSTIPDAGYIQENKVYVIAGNNVYCEYTQITDAEQIADIEEKIANAQL